MKREKVIAALFAFFTLTACGRQDPISPLSAQAEPATLNKSGGLEIFLDSTIALDEGKGTITLPLFKGTHNGDDAWYVVTESSDREDAERRGINWSPKLINAIGTRAVQQVAISGGRIAFKGTVNFAPVRTVVPGPGGFPPVQADPGSIGDEFYTPLITVGDGIVLNAPQIANHTGVHDRVVNIDFERGAVTLRLTAGLYHGKGILYISTDATDPGVAALEEATSAPNMNDAPGLGLNDPSVSARSAIVPFVNGQTGAGHPERQGLQSALLGEGSPLNVTEIHPRNRGSIPTYSPLWDVHLAVWTDAAIAAGERRRLDHHQDIAEAVEEGWIVSGGTGPMNPVLGGLRAAGIIVNCPIMALGNSVS